VIRYFVLSFTAIFLLQAASEQSFAQTAEPGWGGPVIARGELRAEIQSTPVVERSYRPFHIYGNTVRRRYYRRTAVPAPRDLFQAAGSIGVRGW